MEFIFDTTTLFTGLFIFIARVADVSLGTIRTISIVHGNMRKAFLLGFIEISLWLVVITTVLHQVIDNPVLGFFYALGFSTGNVVGIIIERHLAGGPIILRILLAENNNQVIVKQIEERGINVMRFEGHGSTGKVCELYMSCPRKEMFFIVKLLRQQAPDALYMVEQAGRVNRVLRPTSHVPTGWRAVFKRK